MWDVVARFRYPESAAAARRWLEELSIAESGSATQGIDPGGGVTFQALINRWDLAVVTDTVYESAGGSSRRPGPDWRASARCVCLGSRALARVTSTRVPLTERAGKRPAGTC
jgi:hypothetical protein